MELNIYFHLGVNMNKQLIIDNKQAFDHWLNGRQIWYKKDQWYIADITAPAFWDNADMSIKIVINDEYVKFRKALAEGKEVQLKNVYGYDSNVKKDKWMKVDKIYTHIPLQYYRIAPKDIFKIGDWIVSPTGKITQLIADDIPKQLETKGFNLWQPKSGEYHWFWSGFNTPQLLQFSEYDVDAYLAYIDTDIRDHFAYCEPCLALPTVLSEPCKQ